MRFRAIKALPALATAVALTAPLALTGPASAAPAEPAAARGTTELQRQIDRTLANTEGGTQISVNEIAWNGGEAIMSFPLPGERKAPPSSLAARKLQAEFTGVPLSEMGVTAADNCPTQAIGKDWYCFWETKNFEGRRLTWNNSHKSKIYFSDYNFHNKTSSWSNKGDKTIYVYARTQTGSDASCTKLLWTESPHTHNSSLPANLDDRADCFKTS
ncbi:peptidase inhibitor family I36 protein [Streptomyces sp. NPDC101062]|uniref:peptidase inhibitor family I36 protein n=1 Tax=unclassified Streptomyces TaxID=2593676 RepID=UPI002E78F5C8|nr:peptidase inhibitor family I36 protein [Streptomyces sp. JV176]MEE1804144.1 peptidase inhibitor family I36 protein [Streptomyces sp. JV176]